MKLVVIMPALNEEATIEDVARRIPRQIEGIDDVSVLVVDDGSTDRTAELARQDSAEVISHGRTRGVGVAFATGIDGALRVGADVIVNMDSDGQFNPEDIPKLLQPILNEGYGFVTCTRFGNTDYVPEMPALKKWGNGMMCRLINRIIWKANFTDVSCGFRAYSRDTALRLNLYGGFTYTQETFIDLAAKGVQMTEVPLRVRGVREHGTSRVASNLWQYAAQTLPIILRAMRDTRPLTFFGAIAAAFLGIGLILLGFVGTWWLATGGTSPWTSLITVGAASTIICILIFVLSLIADQLGRSRRLQEQLLYYERLRHYSQWQGMPTRKNNGTERLPNADESPSIDNDRD